MTAMSASRKARRRAVKIVKPRRRPARRAAAAAPAPPQPPAFDLRALGAQPVALTARELDDLLVALFAQAHALKALLNHDGAAATANLTESVAAAARVFGSLSTRLAHAPPAVLAAATSVETAFGGTFGPSRAQLRNTAAELRQHFEQGGGL